MHRLLVETYKLSIQPSGPGYTRRGRQWRRGKHALSFRARPRCYYSECPQSFTCARRDQAPSGGEEEREKTVVAEAATVQTSSAISRRHACTCSTPTSATSWAAPYTQTRVRHWHSIPSLQETTIPVPQSCDQGQTSTTHQLHGPATCNGGARGGGGLGGSLG